MISITWISRRALHQLSDFPSALRVLHREVRILEFSTPIGACKVAPVLPISHSWPGLISVEAGSSETKFGANSCPNLGKAHCWTVGMGTLSDLVTTRPTPSKQPPNHKPPQPGAFHPNLFGLD